MPKATDAAASQRPLAIGDLIIDKFTPKETHFDVPLDAEITLRFRIISDYEDLQKIKQAGAKFALKCVRGEVPREQLPWLPKEPEILARVYLVSHLSVAGEGRPRLTQLDAMKIAKGAGLVFETILDAIDKHCAAHSSATFLDEVKRQKKGSRKTPSRQSDSRQASTTSDAIQTN